MLELRETGYMHHLSRETAGWFFVRDLRLDWRLGAEWFESCLVDYDCVLNWGNWAYFILHQLPARVDDRPGGGPRYTLPRYSDHLMTSQVPPELGDFGVEALRQSPAVVGRNW